MILLVIILKFRVN